MKRAISIRLRITTFLLVAIVLILGSATWLLDQKIDAQVANQADTNLLERAQALSDIFDISRRSHLQMPGQGHLPEFLADDGIVYFRIQCHGETTVSAPEAGALDWPPLTSAMPAFGDMSDSLGTELRGVTLPFRPSRSTAVGSVMPGLCSLALAVDVKDVRQFQQSMDNIDFGCILLGILIVVLLTPWLIRQGLQPLSSLAEAVQRIGPELPDQRLDADASAELKPLIMRFNEVLARMEEGLMRERQFASGVAHELRTPLAELRTMIEVELRYPSGRDLRAFMAELGIVGNEMERLVTALLLLTRIEAGIEQVHFQPVDIGALTGKLLNRCRADIDTQRLALTIQTQGTVFWDADPALLEVTLGNLLGNAVAYAPAGSCLVLGYRSSSWWVDNEAPDLKDDDMDFMRRRFWRKGRDTSLHSGLGVALATASATAQGMHLNLSLKHGTIRAEIDTDRPTHPTPHPGAQDPPAGLSRAVSFDA